MKHRFFPSFIKQLFEAISRDQLADQSAQLAYWSLFAIFPFAMFLLTVIGYLPLQGIDQQLTHMVYQAMPGQAAQLVDHTVHEIVGKQRGTLLILSLLGAIWSASGGVSATMSTLNRAYEVEETRPYWKTKLLALGMTLGAAAMIIIAVASLIIGPDIAHHLFNYVGLGKTFDVVWTWLRWPVIVLAMIFMTACVYYFLPNVKQKFRIITPGAVVAICLWVVASLGFDLYVSHFDSYAKTYGALGTAIVLITWIYLSCFVIILGGEINAILDRMVGKIRHTEKKSGPVTVPDQGKQKGEITDHQREGKIKKIR